MSGFLQVAFDRFSSPELLHFARQWKIDLVEVDSLKLTSAMIQALYDEAEVKQLTSDAVKLWLDHLKQLLYDAEDILDEYSTELLTLIKLGSEYQTQQVRNPLLLTPSVGISSFSSLESPPMNGSYNITEKVEEFKRFIGSKVRDMDQRLTNVAQKGVALGLNSRIGTGYSRHRVFSERPPTSSLVISSKVFGREEDKRKIVEWLLSDITPRPSNGDNNFSVLPILGMGGAGKTTLAQLVYNDITVENSKHFDLKAWVCISEDFDVVRLTREILESVTQSSREIVECVTQSSPTSNSLDVLQMKLKQALSRKRFLLVLDDMWNENYERWDALITAFAFSKAGSKILVTTRNKGVSSIVRTDLKDNDYDLKGLSDKDCFALFRRHAFVDGNSPDASQKLEAFGQVIVNKCKGLPLAVKTLAGLLQGKRETSEWEDILENAVWDLKDSEILPSLMLSYHHLRPLVKRCFAYCALFPKGYVFNKMELVMLWMAEGIVQPDPKGRKRMEDIGAGYFDELYMRSFFELSNHKSPFQVHDPLEDGLQRFELFNEFHFRSFFESSIGNIGSGFVMHDLIHDLAQFVSGGLYCQWENYDNKSSKVHTTTRHLSFITENFTVEATESEAMKSLRTIIDLRMGLHGTLFQLQFQFQFLRVLRMIEYGNCELPDSIGGLRHLRLLDLSFSDIQILPNSITSLYNLQTLILRGCCYLRELPEDMGSLVSLRHLFLPVRRWNPSCSMPLIRGVSNFSSIQTLSTFTVGSENSCELGGLSQQLLRGTLDILNLENAGNINGTETTAAILKSQPHLLGLRLHWSKYGNEDCFLDLGRDEIVEEDVLEQLEPHTNLEALWIVNYGGMRFPSWMEDPSFSNLKIVKFINCHKCRFLPYLGQLPLLKYLVINGCSATKMVGSELCGNVSSSTNKQFRSLEKLRIESMDEWEEWSQVVEEEEGGGQFPCLRELSIRDCPKLRIFSYRFPRLVELKIKKCGDLRVLPVLPPSLRCLSIWKCPKLVVFPSLPSIEKSLSTCELIRSLSNSTSHHQQQQHRHQR